MNCIWASLLAVVLTSRQKSREISHLIKVLLMLELRSSKPISGVVALSHVGEDRRSPAGVDRVHVRARRLISSMRSSTSLVSRTSVALSWDSRCFMVRGPIIAR